MLRRISALWEAEFSFWIFIPIEIILVETASSGGIKGQARSELRPEVKPSSHRDQKSWVSSSEKQAIQATKITWAEFMSGSILVECQLRFQVNFDWDLFEIIHEVHAHHFQ